MLRRWIGELAAFLNEPAELAENADAETVEGSFASLVGRAALRRQVLVLVDALDQFEQTPRGRFLTWLPTLWPANARLFARAIPSALMFAALNEQDLLCRVFGDCRWGDPIDREVGDLVGSAGPLRPDQKLFTYLRYNAELTREGLDALACRDIEPASVQQLDSIDSIPDLRRVGKKVAESKVLERHFEGFMPS
jgi:hypothetical protein